MKIFIATGASGGHIYPALTVADVLRSKGHQIIFVGVFRQWQELIRREKFDFVELPIKAWNTKSLKSTLISLGYVLQSTQYVSRLIAQHHPDRILGFGGYGSFPVVFTGWLRHVPAFIHEQNVVAGRANKCLGWLAHSIMVSFPETTRYFSRKKVLMTGYPLRKFNNSFFQEDSLKEFGLSSGILTIAVCGGSQGSRALNHAMVQACALLKDQVEIQVLHIAGECDCEIVSMGYARLGIRHKVFSFFHEMEKIYCAADVIVARAGAGLIHEIDHFGIPAVIVPYPYAGAHQKHNAIAYVKKGRGMMIEEKHLTAERLCGEILNLAKQCDRSTGISREGMLSESDAAQRIADIITGDLR